MGEGVKRGAFPRTLVQLPLVLMGLNMNERPLAAGTHKHLEIPIMLKICF